MNKEELDQLEKTKMSGYVRKRTHMLFLMLSIKKGKTVGKLLDEVAEKLINENPEYEKWLEKN